jgi:geranylgeranyl pyrophosphate synthase
MDDMIRRSFASDQITLNPSPSDSDALAAIMRLINKHIPANNDLLAKAARYHFRDTGKMLRARLALSAEKHIENHIENHSPTATYQATISWAAAIEVLHNASLIHDDISDGDQLRRNRPTVWFKFGRDIALALGDWLIGLSFQFAADAAALAKKPELVHILAKHMLATTEGQAKEFRKHGYPGMETYRDIIRGKTAPLFIAPIEGVAVIAGRLDLIVDSHKYFESVGSAYQVANDLLNFAGTDGSEQSATDLIRRAPNAVIVLFRENATPREKARFNAWLNDGKPSDITHWLDAIRDSDAISQTSRMMEDMLEHGEECYQNMPEFMRQIVAPVQKLIHSVRIQTLVHQK